MTARERKASEGASATLTAQSAARESIHGAGRNGAQPSPARAFAWEEWFEHAGLSQREEILALAARQGVIYASQVPPPVNGISKSISTSSAHACSRLLAGMAETLTPIVAAPVAVHDTDLDAAQREAVARALATPDVFLLEGLPGTGRSRVLAEILHQSALRGERTLFLAKSPAALDVVLSRLVDGRAAFPIRYLDPAENAATMAPHLAKLTPAQCPRLFKERTLQNAAAAKADAECQLRRRHSEEACWPALRSLAEQLTVARQSFVEAEKRLATVADDVQGETSVPGPLAEAIGQSDLACRVRLDALSADLDKNNQEGGALAARLAEVDQALRDLLPLARAKEQGRWWSLAWWRATVRGRVRAKLAAVEERRQALQGALLENAAAQALIQRDCEVARQTFEANRSRLIAMEVDRRRQECGRALDEQRQKIDSLVEAWHKQTAELEMADHRPAETSASALAGVHERWEKQRLIDAQALEFACRFDAFAKDSTDGMALRVAEWATVFAGTMNALARDRTFAEVAGGPFDLLVLEDAGQFTETDLLKVGRRAARWVLVAEGPVPAASTGGASANGKGVSANAPALADCFTKLWRLLHHEPSRNQYVWSWENGRLCCTLRPLSAGDHAHLETERVADFPEIELRILAVPRSSPVVAQVLFPASMTLAQAKAFIYRELEEAAMQTSGRCAWLAAADDGVQLRLSPLDHGKAECVELETGLREWLVPVTSQTCRLDFSERDGWSPARVDEWLARHMHWRDSGRTMALRVSYRMAAGLACAVNAIVFEGGYVCNPRAESGQRQGIEFVAVPPMRADGKHTDGKHTDSKHDQKRHALDGGNSPCEGAGLELDLASPHGADRMPTDLRGELPRHGVANYPEAQALIRRLEDLTKAGLGGPVGVIALQEGQALLLRRLAARSELLRQHPAFYEIGTPADFAEREWPTVLVSMTRSHGRRVMPYTEHTGHLVRALTRAGKRLILFGDAGHLAKRGQRPLDRLDSNAECRMISALVCWLTAASEKNALAPNPIS